ncbi:hypothetical protein BDV41DRAFT_523492 [Aspergillus transmontanensis]|uniref:Uncharacterized protein n=1 Tax=Aspergillus transmontanensis TaxID=1034304 RepID=A0A5N6WE79_9EURO|nr:hypothetical protein BDV41DRAFT_523492 [Aspergillus transmontanensis]
MILACKLALSMLYHYYSILTNNYSGLIVPICERSRVQTAVRAYSFSFFPLPSILPLYPVVYSLYQFPCSAILCYLY